MLTVGGLFSGIGGWELGLERAGMVTAWHCDSDPFCQRVLEARWPGVPCYGDVRTLSGTAVEPVDVLCGGFPCQDLSVAGKGAGIDGARSGLWGEFARLIGELRPRYVLVENVAVLRRRGLGRVLGDLSVLGYDAEWDRLRAADFGAPHQRARLWIVAYPYGEPDSAERRERAPTPREGAHGRDDRGRGAGDAQRQVPVGGSGQDSCGPDAGCARLERHGSTFGTASEVAWAWRDGSTQPVADSDSRGRDGRPRIFGPQGWAESADSRSGRWGPWAIEPPVGRVAHGIPSRVDRLTSLGNALVPQVAEWIGRRIVEWEAAHAARP